MTDVSTEARVRVAVADDHDLFRSGLIALLKQSSTVRVVGSVGDGLSAVRLCMEQEVQVLLLDVSMPGQTLEETLADLSSKSPATRVLIISMYAEAVVRERVQGAEEYEILSKSAPFPQVIDAIGRLHGRLVTHVPDLSPREIEVMELVARAQTNTQIASALHIAPGTVKRHLGNIFAKFNAVSRLDAVNRARQAGLVEHHP
jgi:DNA-binding NarL/FixJ family response regulator